MYPQTPSSLYNPTPPPENRPNWGLILAGCAATLVLCCGLGLVLGLGGLYYLGQDPAGLVVDYEMPQRVAVDEPFTLVLTLENRGTADLAVGDIDLDTAMSESLLDGAVVLNTDPEMERNYSVSDIKTFKYNQVIPPGETRTVTFELQATQVGEFGGPVSVYVGIQSVRLEGVWITVTK